MNTIHCPECDEPLPGAANYCPVCGISRTLLGHRSDDTWLEIRQSVTWRKEVTPSPDRANLAPLPPRPARSRPPMWNTWRRIRYQIRPTIVVWISLVVFLFLIFGGVFGIVVTRGSGVSNQSDELALQVTPDNVAVGATVMLNGEHFKPYGKIGLTRDTSIPVLDTANTTIVDADRSGNFTDTIVITPDWDTGLHTVNAEDAFMHKVASFSIMVTGHAGSLRPAHLRVSVDTLDLGSGDQATNTTKTITLTNIGGGLISWQANSSQSWLLLSPPRGTFASGHSASVMVAIDRSKLNSGSYSAQINIFSTAGNNTVPVTAAVTPLISGYRAVLQANPALLSFTAIDGGPSPSTQIITVSNPGLLSLQWQATTNASWLFVSPQSAIVDPASNLPVTVRIDSSLLLPGTYNGAITLSTRGSDANGSNLQTVFVTVTIMPQSVTQTPLPLVMTAPGALSFRGVVGQLGSAIQKISIANSGGIGALNWTATTTGGDWLAVYPSMGTLMAHQSVSFDVTASVLPTLVPGTYRGAVTIIGTDSSGHPASGSPQVIPVSLLVQPACTFAVSPSTLNLTGISGQVASVSQQITLLANPSCTNKLNWTVTASGGNWLTASIAGTTTPIVNVSATLAHLNAGNYSGTVTITARDSVTGLLVGVSQVVPIVLTAQSACALLNSSSAGEVFAATAGSNPPAQIFTISVTGTCSGAVTITPAIVPGSETTWLSVATTTATVASGKSAAFTVTVTSAGLPVGQYQATIQLSSSDSGMTMMNSVGVKLNVNAQSEPVIGTPTPTPSPIPTSVATIAA